MSCPVSSSTQLQWADSDHQLQQAMKSHLFNRRDFPPELFHIGETGPGGFHIRYIPFNSLLFSQKTIDFATQVLAIAVVFPIPQEILSSYHFFHLNSS